MSQWQHSHCGAVYEGRTPPLECACLGEPGWVRVGTAPFKQPKRKKGGSLSQTKRQRIYERDGFACVACGSTENLTLDHILPRCMGGRNSENNLQTMCRACNQAKADSPPHPLMEVA